MRRYVLVAAVLLAACQQDPPGRCAASLDCALGQECSDGVCIALATDHQVGSRCIRDADCVAWAGCAAETCRLAAGMCTTSADCAGWEACDATHACATAPGRCASTAGCRPWEVCSATYYCENGPGYCASGADCAAWQQCNAVHACATAPGFCAAEADCAAWQDCGAAHLCAPAPGMCSTSADCASWDFCDAVHACVHGPGYCGSAADCSPWEACDAVHACVTAPGFCGTSADCLAWEVCSGTHTCVSGPGYCGTSADCAAWQQCDAAHACVAAPGFCAGSADCQTWEVCNGTSHTCEIGPGYCGSSADCASWQQCGAAHACVAAPGFCAGSADCQTWEVCNGTSHTCEIGPGYCGSSADCASWQQCDARHACVAAPGFCAASVDCRVWEVCNATSHTCENGPGYCASSTECASWQQCNAVHACVAAPGMCSSAAECQTWQVCNTASHTCENGPGYCASKADCAGWQECDGSHACVLCSDCCQADIDCEVRYGSWAVCGPSHVCVPTAGYCIADSDCAVGNECDHMRTHQCVHADGWCADDSNCQAPETCSSYGTCFNAGSGGADWIRRVGYDSPNGMSTEFTSAYRIACLDDGDLVANLYARGNVDPGDGVIRSGSLFVSFAAADGSVQWVKALESTGLVEPAPGGEVILAGYAPGDLGAGPVPKQFVARIAGDGAVVWQRELTAGPMSVNTMAVSPSGEIVLTGGSWTVVNGSIAESWVVVTKLDATGGLVWSTRPIDDAPGTPFSMDFDPAGNVVIAVARNQVRLDGELRALSIVVLDGATGTRLSRREYGTDPLGRPTLGVTPRYLDVAADGSILVAGTISTAISFGGALLEPYYGTDPFVLKLGPTGDFLWNVQARGTYSAEYGKSAQATRLPDGTTYLAAIYNSEVAIGAFTFGSYDPFTVGAYLARINADGVVTTVTPFRLFGWDLQMWDLCSSDGHIGWIDHHADRLILGGLPAESRYVVDAFVARLNP